MFKVIAKATNTGLRNVMKRGTKKDCIEFAKKLNEVTKNDFINVTNEKTNEIIFSIFNDLIEEAKANNTYICGADGKLCGFKKSDYPEKFPCDNCKRKIEWLNGVDVSNFGMLSDD